MSFKDKIKNINIKTIKEFFQNLKSQKKDSKAKKESLKDKLLFLFQKKSYVACYKNKFFKVEENKKVEIPPQKKVDYSVVNISKIFQEFISLPIPNKKKTKQYIKTFVEAKMKIDLNKYYFDYYQIGEDIEKKELIFSLVAIEKSEIEKIRKMTKIKFSALVPIEFAVSAYISNFLNENELGIALIKLGEEELKVILVKDNFPLEIITDYVSFDYEDYINRIISYFSGKYSNFIIKVLYFLDLENIKTESFSSYQVIIDNQYDFVTALSKSRLKIRLWTAYLDILINILFYLISIFIIYNFITSFLLYKKQKEHFAKLESNINHLEEKIKKFLNTYNLKKEQLKTFLKHYNKLLKYKDIDEPNFINFLKQIKNFENKIFELLKLYESDLYLTNIEIKKDKYGKMYLQIKGQIKGETKGQIRTIAIELRRNFENVRFNPKYPRPPITNFEIQLPIDRGRK